MKNYYIYVGGALGKEYFKKNSKLSPSTNNFELNNIESIYSEVNEKLLVLTQTFVQNNTDKKFLIARKKIYGTSLINFNTIGYINFAFLRTFTSVISLFLTIKYYLKIIKKKHSNYRFIFFVYNPFALRVLPVFLAKRRQDILINIQGEPIDQRIVKHKKSMHDNLTYKLSFWLFKKNDLILSTCENVVNRYAPHAKRYPLYFAANSFALEFSESMQRDFTHKNFIFSGTIDSCYGIEIAIEALQYLPENYNFIICGSGAPEIEELIRKKAYNDKRIRFLGRVSQEESIKLQHICDALLLVRVRNSERDDYLAKYASPGKLSEYLASGTPIIATNIPAIPKILYKYLNVTEPNALSLAELLYKICENKTDIYIKKAKTGRKFAQENCTIDAQRRVYRKVIQEIEVIGKKIDKA